MARARPITLKVLSPDACMTLFAFHALGDRNFDGRTDLEVLGRKIVEKCKGLPLAVKALAGLLRAKVSPREWEAVLNSKIWDLPEERINILPALKLSYLHLPSYLRRCFAYCAIFPQDYEIQRDELIHWWIAEGFVEGKEGKDRWNAGLNYFDELVSRSLFQNSSSSELRFLMHDLVNDLAKLVAGATHFSSGELEFEHDKKNASLARHASFISSIHIVPERFKIYHQMKGLRSFISLRKQSSPYSYLSQKVICDLLQALKYLRVISLSHYGIGEVPDCIGKLRHLRHLNLSYTNIKMLPKSIVALYNLEALMLRGCNELIKLPEDMEKLINLRYLDITDTPSLIGMPLNIGNLVGLEMLSKFVVGTENGSRLKELKNLENLRGELCISDLHMVQEARDATDANLYTKKGICRLTMQWCRDFENFRDEELEAKVLDLLCPHQNLQILKIFFYGGLEFPSWLGSPPHVNIVHLHLHGCRRAKTLPSLGQLSSLKELYIEGLNAICKVGSEFYGTRSPFMSLITLEFKDMPLWEDWSHWVGTEEVGVLFPRLEHLIIQDCPILIGTLPSQLSSLIELEINSCPRMDASPSITSLPSLEKLKFRGCNEGVLKSLVNLTSLTALAVKDVANLTCLSHGFTSSLIKLEELEMGNCKKLLYLWQDIDIIGNLACLKRLVVHNCSEFIYFGAGKGDIELPINLETIELTDCVNLEKLPCKMHTLSSLINLTVDNCPKLVSFPETGIPTSVISLYVGRCNMLQSLARGLSIHPDEPSSGNSSNSNNRIDMTSCLQELTIDGCNSLPASLFSEGRFLPATLKTLKRRIQARMLLYAGKRLGGGGGILILSELWLLFLEKGIPYFNYYFRRF
ncbi:putative disease resistance protein At3g14460 [Syzygium oleosum]|uniref:putative disease resistance protein At3g14460 n=1 Tax=Syzygium oleosum TaxID=219896 RepID=UPI0024BB4842|nr:putative disease resistance protein At3g14460 [Syzygium oleosum]